MRRALTGTLLVLLATLAFWVLSWREAPVVVAPAAEPVAETKFPRRSAASNARAEKRRTFASRFDDAGNEAAGEPVKRDPLMVAFGSEAQTALVMESREMLDTPAGRLIANCLVREQAEAFDQMVEDTGLDPLEDVDRWGVFGGDAADNSDLVMVAEGRFSGMKLDAAVESGQLLAPQDYGHSADIYPWPAKKTEGAEGYGMAFAGGETADGADELVYAMWSDSIALFGNRAEVEASIDRLEGRTAPGKSAIPEWEAYGEAYGQLPAAKLAAMMPPEFRDGLLDMADSATLHMDAPEDVFMTTNVVGSDPKLRDIGLNMAKRFADLRALAERQGNQELVDMLDLGSITPTDEGFSVETTMPLDLLEKHMQNNCKAPEKPSVN